MIQITEFFVVERELVLRDQRDRVTTRTETGIRSEAPSVITTFPVCGTQFPSFRLQDPKETKEKKKKKQEMKKKEYHVKRHLNTNLNNDGRSLRCQQTIPRL